MPARDPDLNCFTAKTFQRAEREAAAIDGLYAEGKPLPPLAGVPFAVKNLFDVEGIVTLAGAKINAGNAPAAADATIVARMSRAGAILVGALNMEELAYGFLTENHHYGIDPQSARSHARRRRFVRRLGRGGRRRNVADCLGVRYERLDSRARIAVWRLWSKTDLWAITAQRHISLCEQLRSCGARFQTASSGLALSYDAMQGPDLDDPACAQRAMEPAGVSLSLPRGIRIGILGGWFHEWADPAARRSVQLAAAALGATEWTELKSAEVARAAAYIITGAEGGALHRPRLIDEYEDFGPSSRARLVAGSLIPATWVIQAQRVRRQAYLEAMDLFDRFDLLIAAAAPAVAPRIGQETLVINGRSIPTKAGLGVLTQPISCIGLPVCTVPVWPGEGDSPAERALPVGVQLIGAPWREGLCLAAARTLEQAGIAEVR